MLTVINVVLTFMFEGFEDLFVLNDFFIYEETLVWTHHLVENAANRANTGSGLVGISQQFLENISRKQLGYDQCDK